MKNKMKMRCRECKLEYDSDEWRKTGNLIGFCSDACRAKHRRYCSKSPLSDVLIGELNNISRK